MNSTPLTAELMARAIVAAAVNLGELTPLRQRSADITVRSYLPAATGIALEAKHPLADVCRILRIEPEAVICARRDEPRDFQRAQAAVREALRYHISGQAPPAAPEAVQAVAAPKVCPPRARPFPPRSSSLPKGARVVSLGDGVQKIVVRPIPEGVARHAKQQLDRGADLAFVAECFGYEPEAIQRAVETLSTGDAA